MTLAPGPLAPAFRTVFDHEFGYVCRALRRLGIHEGDIADVAQELFLTVHRQFADWDRERPVRPWLFSFALRFAANYRKLARHRLTTGRDEDIAAPPRDRDGEARDLVLRALAELDFERRVVLVMHDLEGFSAAEIGAQMGTPVNTASSRLRLARVDFRSAVERLQRKGGTP